MEYNVNKEIYESETKSPKEIIEAKHLWEYYEKAFKTKQEIIEQLVLMHIEKEQMLKALNKPNKIGIICAVIFLFGTAFGVYMSVVL